MELTEASFREFVELTKLFNIHGLHPIVIGGWAVYYYAQGAKSVDIDLIVPNKQALQIFEKYCTQHNFKKDRTAKIRTLYKKEFKTQTGQTEEIHLDVFLLTDKNLLAANQSIEIPWKLAEKYWQEWKLETKAIARVPIIEVLLLYKTAALIDRKYKLKNWQNLSKVARDRLTAKIEKDRQDIQGLLKQEIDNEKIEKLLQETKFAKYYKETTKELR